MILVVYIFVFFYLGPHTRTIIVSSFKIRNFNSPVCLNLHLLIFISVPLLYSFTVHTNFSLGYDIFERGTLKDSVAAVGALDTESSLPLRQGCFYLLVFVPISCALLQLLAWSRFTLHGRRLRGIKAMRQGAQHLIDVKAI